MYRKNVASQFVYFTLISATDGSPVLGASVTVKRTIDGAAQASATGTVNEKGSGQYELAMSQADTNGNNIGFMFSATGALIVSISIVTTAADPTNATTFGLGNLDAAVSAVKAKTDSLTFTVANQVDSNVIDWKSATAPAMTGDAFARLGAPAGASVSVDIAAVKTDTGAIKAKTDSLTFTVAGLTDSNVVDWKGATAPAMTGDAFARLGAPAGASVSVDVAAVKTDTAAVKLQTDKLAFTVTNQVDANVLDWKSATAPAMTGDAYARLGAPAGASVSADIAAVKTDTGKIVGQFIRSGTCQDPSGSTTTIKLDAGSSSVDRFYNECVVVITGGTGAGQARAVESYSGATRICSFTDALGTATDATSTFAIFAAGAHVVWSVGSSAANTIAGAVISAIVSTSDSDYAGQDNLFGDAYLTNAIKAKTDNLPASPAAVGSAMTLTSGERTSIANALLDLADAIETGVTPRSAMRLQLAALAGKLSGAATTSVSIRNVGDTKNRIVATVDADGNRTSVTVDGS